MTAASTFRGERNGDIVKDCLSWDYANFGPGAGTVQCVSRPHGLTEEQAAACTFEDVMSNPEAASARNPFESQEPK